MLRVVCMTLCALALCGLSTSVSAEEKVLFNGKDLTGWKGRADLWSVKDGAITGTTSDENPIQQNTFLVWQGGEVSDFELTLEYRIVAGNSGIQYRSEVVQDTKETGPIIKGYQADFEAGTTYSGILYEERGRGILAQRGQKTELTFTEGNKHKTKVDVVGSVGDSEAIQASIKSEDWNSYKIVAKGNHLQHFINGMQTVDVTDKHPKQRASGVLAFQVHRGPAMVVQFRNIVLKPLH